MALLLGGDRRAVVGLGAAVGGDGDLALGDLEGAVDCINGSRAIVYGSILVVDDDIRRISLHLYHIFAGVFHLSGDRRAIFDGCGAASHVEDPVVLSDNFHSKLTRAVVGARNLLDRVLQTAAVISAVVGLYDGVSLDI